MTYYEARQAVVNPSFCVCVYLNDFFKIETLICCQGNKQKKPKSDTAIECLDGKVSPLAMLQ